MKKLFIILAVLVAIATPAIAQAAGTSTGTLNVQLTLAGTCGVQNTTLDFGLQVYNSGTPSFGVGSVDVICSPFTAFSVDLDGGLHLSLSGRRLYFNSGGAGPLAVDNFIVYNLYTDAAHAHIWGSCCSGSTLGGFSGTGMMQHQPVYGLIAAGQMSTQAPGFYTDTVMVIVTF